MKRNLRGSDGGGLEGLDGFGGSGSGTGLQKSRFWRF